MDHDAIVIGSRLAGAATAMLLARSGLDVLVVDRARFPSDTLSSHQLQLPGGACLRRWGLLDRLLATGVPPTRRVRFEAGTAVLEADFLPHEGVDALYSPRRTVLDTLLVQAAREAGAEVVEGFEVHELVMDDDRVAGIRGHERGAGRAVHTHRAPLVIGADGKSSWLARAVGARTYRDWPRTSAAFYTYWEGLELSCGEIYARDTRLVAAWPTHDGLTVTFIGLPSRDFDDFRRDPQAATLASLDVAGDLGLRARSATRVEPVRGTNDLPQRFRVPYGPGWLLVGDAGLVLDPLTGQGMANALVDAERLAAAVLRGLGGASSLELSLRAFHRQRDKDRLAMAELTADLATFDPRPGGDRIFSAIAANPQASARFLGLLAGTESPRSFFGPRNMRRLLGWRGTAALLRRGRGAA